MGGGHDPGLALAPLGVAVSGAAALAAAYPLLPAWARPWALRALAWAMA